MESQSYSLHGKVDMESSVLTNNAQNGDTDPPSLLTTYLSITLVSIVLIIQFHSRLKLHCRKKLRDGDGPIFGLDDIPSIKPFLPIKFIGSLPKFLPFSKSLETALKWHRDYPILKLTGANKTFVGFNTPELVQQLLKSTDFGHGVKAPVFYDNMQPFITNGILVSSGKFWHGQRKILMRSQSYQSLKAYVGVLNKHSEKFNEELVELFQDGNPRQINGVINSLFLKVIWEITTGYEVDHYHCADLERCRENFKIWKKALMLRILQPWLLLKPLWRLHPMSRRYDKAVEEVNQVTLKRIEKHRQNRKNLGVISVPEKDPGRSSFKSVLDELMDAEMDEKQILDEVNSMIFAGHETGATTVHFFCFSIALNPKIQELCRKEVDELFETENNFTDGRITYDALQSNLRFVERCILETLRLFPPIFVFLRELRSPLTVEHYNKTYELPVGTNISVFTMGIHRDPKMFPDPKKFDPDRFLPEEISKRHAYSFIPFSGGQRNCLGQKLAMMEIKMVVAHLLWKFVITTTDKMEDIPLLPFITPTPRRDYTFMFEKRVH